MSDSSFTKGPAFLQAIQNRWSKFAGTSPATEAGASEGIIGAIAASAILDSADALAVVKGALTGLNVGTVGDSGLALFNGIEEPIPQQKSTAWQPPATGTNSKST